MPIKNCKIDSYAPRLPIVIENPNNGKIIRTWGIIDTGASECAIPAEIAILLGHDLNKGIITEIKTGNGIAKAYKHTTNIYIYHPVSNELVKKIERVPIDCMPNLPIVLLGVKSFLSHFTLVIDYPANVFSLINNKK